MRAVLIIFIACLIAFGFLLASSLDPHNYIKIYFNGYVAEFNLLGFCLLLLLTVLILFLLFRVLYFVLRSPKLFNRWQKDKNHNTAEQNLGEGYLSLIRGDWKKAESQLLNKANYSGIAHINYLAAAKAAQEQGNYSHRDQYLKQAYELAPKHRLAIGLTKAQLHHQAGQNEHTLATLKDLEPEGKKNPQFTAMLAQAYAANKDWIALQQVLPDIAKQKSLPKQQLNALQNQILNHTFSQSDDLESIWKRVDKAQKQNPENVLTYAYHLNQIGKTESAEKLIVSTLKEQWSNRLIDFYASLNSINPKKALSQIERWLITHPENAQLNLAAGKAALQLKKTEDADAYLQKSIDQGQLPEAYSLMAELLEQSGETNLALEHYQIAMKRWVEQHHTDKRTIKISQIQS